MGRDMAAARDLNADFNLGGDFRNHLLRRRFRGGTAQRPSERTRPAPRSRGRSACGLFAVRGKASEAASSTFGGSGALAFAAAFLPFLAAGTSFGGATSTTAAFLAALRCLLLELLGGFLLLLLRVRQPCLLRFPLGDDLLADRLREAQVDGRRRRKHVETQALQFTQHYLVLNRTLGSQLRNCDFVHLDCDLFASKAKRES